MILQIICPFSGIFTYKMHAFSMLICILDFDVTYKSWREGKTMGKFH